MLSLQQHTEMPVVTINHLLTYLKEEIHFVQPFFHNPHFFIVTNKDAKSIDFMCSHGKLKNEEMDDSFQKRMIVLSMETIQEASFSKTPAIRYGDEMFPNALPGWISLGSPIYINNKRKGYVSLNYQSEVHISYIVNIFCYIIKTVEWQLNNVDTSHKEQELEKKFKVFQLTKKECEITYCLLENISIKDISKHHFISVETVRTHVKNIYNKVGVNNRVDLIRTFVYHG
ncbi:helix-turn-helix transcriptional regulator [Brevibacillus laterosporus]|uniref:helix-turn-helix transcriptional regulator n=1 Tax=Brevibacillus laterosporus TaxID=1465 RepID=UPI0029589985|nr:LuxR C-terminal-related transcriptional regulator [Brevibacillus laterosporus]WNX33437.1 LuxR C-terminal-related transcriptional regulator [Brevibacillus laterosporus]